ncbi:hypothetical protein Nepgr_018864 [Nepenthes gracilis]|uniref:Disease resistance R13L4/SHOC-2-like LRR domain-containing protein n=1 Tax=Nepenthes gracilis TaxID=150966 RepID=A0AAD3XTV2_NEPGR|nr:hypothetical protein Nepgr_018864 [Nepenthes gracilis]
MGCCASKTADSKANRLARWRSTGIVAIRDSKLKTFPDEILSLDKAVRTVDLTHNIIVDVPAEINQLINMQRLILAGNLIERLPMNLGKLQSLKVMMLDGNRICGLPDELGQLVRLERLSISGNLLTYLPDTIGSLRNLQLLNVSNNKLKSLPESIGSCFSLEELQANDNSIEDLPPSICNLIHLKSLCLNNNNVKQMPSNILKDCKALQNISLHNNPISMDQFQQMDGFQEVLIYEHLAVLKIIEDWSKAEGGRFLWQSCSLLYCLKIISTWSLHHTDLFYHKTFIPEMGLHTQPVGYTFRAVYRFIDQLNMEHKRPFDDELPNEVSSKLPRIVESSDQISLHVGHISSVDAFLKPYHSGEGNFVKNESVCQEKLANGILAEFQEAIEDTMTGLPRSFSVSPWVSSSTSEDDDMAGRAIHLPFSSEYFGFDCPVRSFMHADDTYHLLLDYPPRKRVPIGPEHQADIPDLQRNENPLDDDVGDLSGICVISAPELETPAYNVAGDGWSDCSCEDESSVRCVRQHIIEAREKLRRALGPVAFVELGFHDMGEVVAEKWSEDEELLFQEVVSNPVIMGRNFWNTLSVVFPSRTKMEIVSYYFNVFMLRKRAQQNRVDPMNIDSDNDEWHGSYCHDGHDEGGMTEEDEDAENMSPTQHDGPVNWGNETAEHHEDVLSQASADNDNYEFGCDREFNSKGGPGSVFQPREKKSCDDADDDDLQDGSRACSVSRGPSQGTQVNPDSCEQWRQYVLEPCDAKVWDGYMSCSKNKVDLLSTSCMIKEVFGDGTFDCRARDSKHAN